ncbi:MAG: O-antigen ligase family protein [Bacilli bacterium]
MKNSAIDNKNKIYIFLVLVYLIDTYFRTIFGSLMPKWEYCLVAIIFLFLIIMIFIKEEKINFRRLDVLLLVLLFLVFIYSSLLSNLRNDTQFKSLLFQFIWFFTLYGYSSSIKNRSSLTMLRCNVIKVIFIFMLVCSIINILVYLIIGVLQVEVPFESLQMLDFSYGRFQGFIGNENLTGQLALLGILSTLGLYFDHKLNYLVAFICVLINSVVLYLTDSRASILAIIVCLIILFNSSILNFFSSIKKKNKIIFYLFIMLTTSIILFKILGVRRISNLSFDSIELLLDNITSERYSIWKEIIAISGIKPFYGLGVDNLLEAAKYYIGINSTIVKHSIVNAHNVFLELLYSSGIIGLSLGTLFFSNVLIICKKMDLKDKKNLINICFVISVFIISLLDTGIFFGGPFITPVFWLFCGIVANKCYLEINEL